jgi:NAD(P)-dependent dehydrogenase (short-subunit alcohol dehydrogenase family)
MAAQYAADRIRVNVVAPGLVRTPMAGRAASDPDILDFAGRKQPLAGGMLEPEDIAGAICFLLSDDSSLITGQVLHVDGGWSVSSAYP